MTQHNATDGEDYNKLHSDYIDFFLKYRIVSNDLPISQNQSPVEYVQAVEDYMVQHPMASNFSIYVAGDAKTGKVAPGTLDWLKQVGDILRDKNLLDKFVISPNYDEPGDAEPLNERIRATSMDVQSAVPEWKIKMTTAPRKSLSGYIDPWVGIWSSKTTMENYVEDRIELSEEVWWYGCVGPRYPFPTYHIPDALMSSRLVHWMQKDWQITGNLYWICWEETMTENHEFYVEYSYIHTALYHNTEKPELLPIINEQTPEALIDFTKEEAPHILFTPYLKSLTASLTENVSEPLEKARRIYDFITLNLKYTFMPDYFCLENIAESCAKNFTGDCGVFALLFLTLCRCAGIPACWQSGLTAEPDFCGAHDWVRFYAAPYGWLYADPSYGIAAVRAQNEERRKFYFGNLDACRMVANNAFQAPFTIDKDFWRADPYDNQVGEIETAERGLRYEEFERCKETLLCEEL